MNRYIKHSKENECYKAKKKMSPVGILIHSTGAVNKTLKRYINYPSVCGVNVNKNYWDQAKPDGQLKCVHAFIGETAKGTAATVEILPLDYACWGCGSGAKGSYNYDPTGYIQIEICEGSKFDTEYFNKAWAEAIDYCVWLCKRYNWKDASVITSHKEAGTAGYASKHTDPADYFGIFGKNMDIFRSAVQARIKPVTASITISSSPIQKGRKLMLKDVGLYASAFAKAPVRYLNGTYYLYDGIPINGFTRLCPSVNNVGKLPLGSNVTGYIKISDI